MKKTHSVKSKQFFLKVIVCMVCFVLVNSMAWTDLKVSATSPTPSSETSPTPSSETSPTPTPSTEPDAPAPTSSTEYVMVGGNWVTPTAVYGKSVNVVLPIVNMGEVDLKDVIVTPVISGSSKEWPFEIKTSGYSQTVPDLPGVKNNQSDMDRRRELTWTFDTRADALSGYHKLQFSVLYSVNGVTQSTTLTTYINVVGAPGSGTIESGGAKFSTPRVVVTGFETTPKEVKAGDTFTLVVHLKNTSTRTSISNMLIDLKAATEGTDANTTYSAFLPTSGSNSVYIDKIGKGASADVSIEMTAKTDLVQKPYVLDVKMDFEDDDLNAYSTTASVSIPVKQEARFNVSTPEVIPADIAVGNTSNVMFNIYNTGKKTLYNVQVSFKADSVEGGEAFIGKIDAGGTGNVDTMVTGIAASMDEGIVKAIITYEDESGTPYTFEKDINLLVFEEAYDEGMVDGGMIDDGSMEQQTNSKKTVIIVVIILVVVVAVIGLIVFFIIRKKKKKNAEELRNLLDDVEGGENNEI